MVDMESQPSISYINPSLPVAALGWVIGQGSPMEMLKQPRLLLRQNSCSLPTDSGAPLAKDSIHTTHWTWESPAGAFMGLLLMYSSHFGAGRYSGGFEKET